MFQESKKAGKLWENLLNQAIELDNQEVIQEAIDAAGKLDAFESSTRAGNLFVEYLPNKAENLTYFFDPGDGMYGYFSTLSEEDLLAAMAKVAKKHNLKL